MHVYLHTRKKQLLTPRFINIVLYCTKNTQVPTKKVVFIFCYYLVVFIIGCYSSFKII